LISGDNKLLESLILLILLIDPPTLFKESTISEYKSEESIFEGIELVIPI
jgi:hypothetical protein